jgi:hypothetical protein
MTTDERVSDGDRAFDVLFARAAEDTPLPGSAAERTIRVPDGPGLLLESRRIRGRRRAVGGSLAVAAGLLAVGAVGGAATGAWQFPFPALLGQRGDTGPATLDASRGTAVGDVVNDLDSMRVTDYAGPEEVTAEMLEHGYASWRYRSGAAIPLPSNYVDLAQSADPPPPAPAIGDRRVTVSGRQGAGKEITGYTVVLKSWPDAHYRTDDSKDVVSGEPTERSLGEFEVSGESAGQGILTRPSAEDGWLAVVVMPSGAEVLQVRVTGTQVTLPVDDYTQTQCLATRVGQVKGYSDCDVKGSDGLKTVLVRVASSSDKPPIDALTYLSGEGKSVEIPLSVS